MQMDKIQATLFPEGYFQYENHQMNMRRNKEGLLRNEA